MLVHVIVHAPSHPKKRKQVFYSLGNYVINRQDDGPWSPPLLTNSPFQLTQPLPFLLPWPPPSFPPYKLTPTSSPPIFSCRGVRRLQLRPPVNLLLHTHYLPIHRSANQIGDISMEILDEVLIICSFFVGWLQI